MVHMADRCGQDQFTAGVQRAETDGRYGNAIPLKIYVLFMMKSDAKGEYG